VHGRLDISGPADVAWRLARVWPDAELVLIGQEGHGLSGDATTEAVLAATDRFRPPRTRTP
jgi:proline iminopeptidase